MSQPLQSFVRNRLLTALAPDDFAQLSPALESVAMPLRKIIIVPQEPITHAYFVEDGIVSLIADTHEGRVEIGLVGREGIVGVPLILCTDRSPHLALVQADLTALRIAEPALQVALEASPKLRRMLCRYVQGLIVQIGQTAHANADLTVEGRLARWILMAHDRLDGDELPLTHEFLSIMLSVRRPGVTGAIHVLESTGLIRARRGRITVLDRDKLEEMAGDTYGVAEAEYERLIVAA